MGAICSLGSSDPIVLDLLQQGFQIRLGDGTQTNFWEDRWCDGRSLKEEFPRLFLISINKTAKVRDLLVELESESWKLEFRRNLFVWEEELLFRLKQQLQKISFSNIRKDFLSWKWDQNGVLSAKSFYTK